MNFQELKELVTSGESDRLEFKNSTGQRTAAMKTVCGMLNGLGGFVLFGVSDKGNLIGQDISAKTMTDISAELGRIDPPAFPDVETVTLENGKGIIVLRVSGGGGLYTYDGRPYIRSGPTTSVMPKTEYERRLVERLHSTRRWENEPVAIGVSIKDLDADEIHLTLTNAIDAGRIDRPRKTDTKSILTGLGLIIDGMLTNAAVVLYGKSARLESLYPQCLIQLARFRGSDRLSDFSDNRQYWGHAFSLLQRAEAFFKDHIPIAGKVYPDKFKRKDSPAYHPRAFREALANAFCHRDYAVPGASTSVAVYDDRMEIINPGDLHFGITPKTLMRPHESRPWNPIIASVFYRAGIIEKWGTGTLNIIDWCRENGNPPPEWQVRAGSVVVTFKPLMDKPERQPESGVELDSQPDSQPESQPESGVESLREKIIQLLSKESLSKSEISKQLGQKQISGQLKKVLMELLETGVITFTIPEKPNSRLQKYRLVEK
jgi:ATP-dependent DNA helicase RecG